MRHPGDDHGTSGACILQCVVVDENHVSFYLIVWLFELQLFHRSPIVDYLPDFGPKRLGMFFNRGYIPVDDIQDPVPPNSKIYSLEPS